MIPPKTPIIIVGGGLAGLCAALQAYGRGANVILLDKQKTLSGNCRKAKLGINGALTKTQADSGVPDSVDAFYEDTMAAAGGLANPALVKILVENSADAVHWLQESFHVDLSQTYRLGGHSQPRTHHGKGAHPIGLEIARHLHSALMRLAESEPSRVLILNKTEVRGLVVDQKRPTLVSGVKFINLLTWEKGQFMGPVIMATGGYVHNNFMVHNPLTKYRPDIGRLPTSNNSLATGDGHIIILKHDGLVVDMDKVQVHPTGLINYNDEEAIKGEKTPRSLILGAESLRGEGGIILNRNGERFCDELGTSDHVSGESLKQLQAGNGPLRLVLNVHSALRLEPIVKQYCKMDLLKEVTGTALAEEIGVTFEKLGETIADYNASADGKKKDAFGKTYFPMTPLDMEENNTYYVAYIARVLHSTVGGVKINDKTQVMLQQDGKEVVFEGLYAAGEVAGGIHGHNRLAGSSLLACVVYGRLAADEAASFVLKQLSEATDKQKILAAERMNQICLRRAFFEKPYS